MQAEKGGLEGQVGELQRRLASGQEEREGESGKQQALIADLQGRLEAAEKALHKAEVAFSGDQGTFRATLAAKEEQLLALTAAPLRGRMRWLGVCLPDPYLFLLFMLCVLGFVFVTAVKAWWNGLLNA